VAKDPDIENIVLLYATGSMWHTSRQALHRRSRRSRRSESLRRPVSLCGLGTVLAFGATPRAIAGAVSKRPPAWTRTTSRASAHSRAAETSTTGVLADSIILYNVYKKHHW